MKKDAKDFFIMAPRLLVGWTAWVFLLTFLLSIIVLVISLLSGSFGERIF